MMTASTGPQKLLTPEQWSFLQEALATSSGALCRRPPGHPGAARR